MPKNIDPNMQKRILLLFHGSKSMPPNLREKNSNPQQKTFVQKLVSIIPQRTNPILLAKCIDHGRGNTLHEFQE